MENFVNLLFEDIRSHIEADDISREKIIRLSRSAIRKSSESIRAVHRRDFSLASSLLDAIKSDLKEMISIMPDNGLFDNNAEVAFQEYVEALELYHFVVTRSEPSANPMISLKDIQADIPVPYIAFLHGLCDLVGELRRFTLDSIRLNDLTHAEQALELMDVIFSQLVTLDYPNALVPGIRRKTDLIRNLLEKTRGDLTFTFNRLALATKLDEVLTQTNISKKNLDAFIHSPSVDDEPEEEK